jgi:hypothetical protein
MKQFNPFPEVSGRYGAPMGRRWDRAADLAGVKRLHARHQGGGDGYDKGGAYWGLPSNVWGVWARKNGKVSCIYIRANSREQAIAIARGGEK